MVSTTKVFTYLFKEIVGVIIVNVFFRGACVSSHVATRNALFCVFVVTLGTIATIVFNLSRTEMRAALVCSWEGGEMCLWRESMRGYF